MDIELFREECLALPYTSEDMPFDDTVVVFRLKGKIFGCIPTDKPYIIVLKCNPEHIIELKENYSAIESAYHWNKKYWIQIDTSDRNITNELIIALIKEAYNEVNKKLKKTEQVKPL